MKEEIWNFIKLKYQGKIIANFDMADVDFERNFISKESRKKCNKKMAYSVTGGYYV